MIVILNDKFELTMEIQDGGRFNPNRTNGSFSLFMMLLFLLDGIRQYVNPISRIVLLMDCKRSFHHIPSRAPLSAATPCTYKTRRHLRTNMVHPV